MTSTTSSEAVPVPLQPMAGHVAVITGAASGIGLAAVEAFLASGASVVAADRDGHALDAVGALAASTGNDRLRLVGADMADPDGVDGAADVARSAFGTLSSIFANAGISGSGAPLADLGLDELMNVLRVNVGAGLLAVQAAARVMDRGSVTITAAVAGLRASAGGVAYSASKAALVSLAQTAAIALAGREIRVNAICPGLTRTGMTETVFDAAEEHGTTDRIGQLNPLGRAAAPAEIASVALFLASDQASYINGQAISVDGGLSASLPFTRWRR
jgi:NAD(P)-dependent dehydrogenase (short-subunit alcohol dehydrogenase family)